MAQTFSLRLLFPILAFWRAIEVSERVRSQKSQAGRVSSEGDLSAIRDKDFPRRSQVNTGRVELNRLKRVNSVLFEDQGNTGNQYSRAVADLGTGNEAIEESR